MDVVFLFDSIPWYAALMWVVVLAALIGFNELTRRYRWAGIAIFIALPIILTIFVWPTTAGEGSSTGSWFHWVKVYSALAGCIGFMLIRYNPRIAAMKYALWFPPAILALNIAEAVIRDFQVSGMHGMVDGVFMVGGSWNIMNGIAGILNLVTICGWVGIFVTRDRFQDMVWPDMMWFWIIAYDLWNFAYVYNCVGDHAFYAGAALLISCTIPAFFLRKGGWLQHRAHTLHILLPAASHDRQRAGLGTRRTTGNRRIHPAHASTCLQLGGHLTGGRRLQAGKIHQQLPRPRALDDPARAEHHLTHHLGIGQAEHHHAGIAAQLGGVLHAMRALLQQRRAFVRRAVPQGQRVACGEQAAGHR